MTNIKTVYRPVSKTTQANERSTFYKDVIAGLRAEQKYLQSKYFYNAKGDRLFQEIMRCEEYYPFSSELEIFSQRTAELVTAITDQTGSFDLIELGAGDCTKSGYLLKELLKRQVEFTYMPIDISANIISYLVGKLPIAVPGVQVMGLHGEYGEMLAKASALSCRRKVILFLGSNLGNMLPDQALAFSRTLRSHLQQKDMVIVGLDLKKDPRTILAAYNDKAGITKQFNLNLLERINKELKADFDLTNFAHYPTYDPVTGSCKSYLISQSDQVVQITNKGSFEKIHFKKGEAIYMEVSQKYTTSEIDQMAMKAGFKTAAQFYDSKAWFVDTLWEAI
ncbi:dimethylhistidine N-methyltransferase [Niastella yeongjuensis]|uniref:Dimethylhistidine N-methyltransferase n=1 Tax=Niastella yeongjuensis TaxID=354355 RepID=A0A1V9E1F2_9BACT|nr:L-histidine N(alpha)-methyltransferase [Niastella yeongjuensis]OQP39957.1 dimethylhistidine N-methyltransferase [Niastella yeongjuensis]SEO11606.1 dimethylhistidine N-methyltransferase [Niastella yeongjuensis]